MLIASMVYLKQRLCIILGPLCLIYGHMGYIFLKEILGTVQEEPYKDVYLMF